MVPTSLIALILLVAFGLGWISHFVAWPKRRFLNPYFLILAGAAALMLFTLVLAIVGVEIVWLSWVLLATAILWVAASISEFRTALAAARARDRAADEHRARGR